MLVADLRGRMQTKIDELVEADQPVTEGLEPVLDELPVPWTYKGCKGNQDSLKHIGRDEWK